MPIVSFRLLQFFAIFLVIYYVCQPKYRWITVLCANICFFLTYSPLPCFVIFFAETLLTWHIAVYITHAQSERVATIALSSTIVVLLAALIAYKDIAFFIDNLNVIFTLTGGVALLAMPEWVAPLGISYYTLILISYLLDIYRKTVKLQANPLKLVAFVGYFPHMVTGPFSRYNDFAETLFQGARFSWENIINGFIRILWGLVKVLLIASRVSVLVETLYSAQSLPAGENPYVGIFVVVAALLYVLFAYMNFSGSMDIVIGASEMLGIPLAENFDHPFISTSLSEFWRRWHMTLGFYLKDYLLYPVLKSGWMSCIRNFVKKHFGKRASKNIPTYIGMFITWFCVGFWHGGKWNYIFGSGLFFFIMIVVGLLLEPTFIKTKELLHINEKSRLWRFFQQCRTTLLFAFSVSFGRAGSLGGGLMMWKNAFVGTGFQALTDGALENLGLVSYDYIFLMVGIFLTWVVSKITYRTNNLRKIIWEKSVVLSILCIMLLLVIVTVIGGYNSRIDLMYGEF